MQRELARKAIHVSSVAVPVFVWLVPHRTAAAALLVLTVTALAVELARRRIRPVRYAFLRRTRTLLRPHERNRLAGATWMALAYLAAVLLFPKPVAVAAMLFNGLGDSAAALVGKRWGRHRTGWGKSWEGFAAGLAAGCAVALAVWAAAPGVPLAAGLAGALAASAAEMAPLPLDDNLRVTLAGGAAMLAMLLLL